MNHMRSEPLTGGCSGTTLELGNAMRRMVQELAENRCMAWREVR
jgi:hypothetical protein